jgi:outer membrane biosynthesis protein TonB
LPAPPEGWQGTDAAWWRAGVDTAEAFRDLESLAAMNVEETSAVQRELLPLYRHAPDIVDSLYTRHLGDEMAQLSGPLEDRKREAYTRLRQNFREPIIAKHLGEDIPVPYPDSLRAQNVSGKVTMQVRLNDEGIPQAIQRIQGVHPALDAIAMDATTQMEWRPAYVMRNGRWKAIPSWVRFSVNFRPPAS